MSTAVGHAHVSAPQRGLYLLALALAPIACVALYLFNPAGRNDPYPNCPFLWLTGYYCPGCGTLRAYHQLRHGSLADAIGQNPVTVIALPAMVYAAASMWLTGYRGQGLPQPRWTMGSGWGVAVVLVVFGVIRNIPLESLEWMRP